MNLQSLKIRLAKYRVTKAQLNELNFKLLELEDLLGVKGVSYDRIGGGTGISNTTEEQAFKIIETKNRIKYTMEHKGLECKRIENALSILTELEREVIELKYLEDSSWDTVVYKTRRAESTCKRLEKKALIKMQELLNYSV